MSKPNWTQRIKRMGRVLWNSVQTLLWLALLVGFVGGLGKLGVEWLTGGDFQDLFSFPEAVVLSFWQAIGLLGLGGLLLFAILHIENRLHEIETELMSIDSTLQDLQPLVEEGRETRSFSIDREADEETARE